MLLAGVLQDALERGDVARHDGPGFAFDNEGPRHKVWLEPFTIANRLSTCGEYLAFIKDGVIQMLVVMILYGTLIPNTPAVAARILLAMFAGPIITLTLIRMPAALLKPSKYISR